MCVLDRRTGRGAHLPVYYKLYRSFHCVVELDVGGGGPGGGPGAQSDFRNKAGARSAKGQKEVAERI